MSTASFQPVPILASICRGHLSPEMAVEWEAPPLQSFFCPEKTFNDVNPPLKRSKHP